MRGGRQAGGQTDRQTERLGGWVGGGGGGEREREREREISVSDNVVVVRLRAAAATPGTSAYFCGVVRTYTYSVIM